MRETSSPNVAIAFGPDRADDPLQAGCHRVEGPADAVVVEDLGSQTEDLFDRPGPGPVLHVNQRGGRGEPVGHQRLDHLPMGGVGDVAHRRSPIDDPGDVEGPGEVSDHGEGSERLLHARRPVSDTTFAHHDLLDHDHICYLEA